MSRENVYLIPISIIAASVLVAGAVVLSSNDSPAVENGTPDTEHREGNDEQGSSIDIAHVETEGEPYIGEKDAPVTLAYWTDYQCPFCKRFERETMQTLIEEYVEPGDLRIVLKDFSFLGPDSRTGAIAASAVWETAPDRFPEWHENMFKRQDGENSGWGSKEDIIEMTRSTDGIAADRVSRLMEQKEGEYQSEIEADRREGSQFGVRGTPGFVIGTRSISGAQPTSVFRNAIEQQLN